MKPRFALHLLILIGLSACTGLQAAAPTPLPATPTPTPNSTASLGESAGPPGSCYYVWANQNLPELSQRLQAELQSVVSGASGSAYAFGEDCVATDGTRKFLAMETDFRVRLPVTDLTDEQHMGELIASTMQVINQIPEAQLAGPRPGRVEFEFNATSSSSLRLTVDIQRYRAEATGVTGARLFQLFYTTP